jgi:hypothetical protein
VRHIVQGDERCRRDAGDDLLGHMGSGDRVQHAPDESERNVRLLESPDPAIGVRPPISDVANQQMRVAMTRVTIHRLPDRSAVGDGVMVRRERRCERVDDEVLIDDRADGRSLLRVEQRCLDRLRPVQVGIQATVQQVEPLDVDGEVAVRASSQQLLRHRDAVVVGDQARRRDPVECPHGLDEVRLLVDRIGVVMRLVRGTESEEIGQDEAVAGGQGGCDLGPVVRAAREAVQERHRGPGSHPLHEDGSFGPAEINAHTLAGGPPFVDHGHIVAEAVGRGSSCPENVTMWMVGGVWTWPHPPRTIHIRPRKAAEPTRRGDRRRRPRWR